MARENLYTGTHSLTTPEGEHFVLWIDKSETEYGWWIWRRGPFDSPRAWGFMSDGDPEPEAVGGPFKTKREA